MRFQTKVWSAIVELAARVNPTLVIRRSPEGITTMQGLDSYWRVYFSCELKATPTDEDQIAQGEEIVVTLDSHDFRNRVDSMGVEGDVLVYLDVERRESVLVDGVPRTVDVPRLIMKDDRGQSVIPDLILDGEVNSKRVIQPVHGMELKYEMLDPMFMFTMTYKERQSAARRLTGMSDQFGLVALEFSEEAVKLVNKDTWRSLDGEAGYFQDEDIGKSYEGKYSREWLHRIFMSVRLELPLELVCFHDVRVDALTRRMPLALTYRSPDFFCRIFLLPGHSESRPMVAANRKYNKELRRMNLAEDEERKKKRPKVALEDKPKDLE